MKALVLTRNWSEQPETAKHGVFVRFGIFLDALDKVCKEVEILAFAPSETATVELAARHELAYSKGRQASYKVHAIARRPNPQPWGVFSRYGAGILSCDCHENTWNLLSDEAVSAVAAALARGFDLIFVHRLACIAPLMHASASGASLAPVLLDIDDLEHVALARSLLHDARWPSEHLRWLHLPALLHRTRRATRLATVSYVCSESDSEVLRYLSGRRRIESIPNSVNGPDQLPGPHDGVPTVGFIGSFVHPPNRDAAAWLIDHIWPIVRRSVHDARLLIAGAGAEPLDTPAARAMGVTVLGFVNELRDFYAQIDVAVAPIRFGAGTRVKIIEASAWAKPVVSTRVGAEGLLHMPGREIILAETVPDLASALVALLSDRNRCRELGQSALERYRQSYQRDRVVSRLVSTIVGALNPRESP